MRVDCRLTSVMCASACNAASNGELSSDIVRETGSVEGERGRQGIRSMRVSKHKLPNMLRMSFRKNERKAHSVDNASCVRATISKISHAIPVMLPV